MARKKSKTSKPKAPVTPAAGPPIIGEMHEAGARGVYTFRSLPQPVPDEHGRCHMSDLLVDECYHCRNGMKTLGYLVSAEAKQGDLLASHKEGELPCVFEL